MLDTAATLLNIKDLTDTLCIAGRAQFDFAPANSTPSVIQGDVLSEFLRP